VHLGLQPQAVLEMGGYKVQGRSEDDAQRILENAKALEGWGVKTIFHKFWWVLRNT
jgi:3-methyl-2-oxobutanoate hydroxymethyltransferase